MNLCVRISILDRPTGKMALVWSSGKEMKYVARTLPGSYILIQSPVWTRLHRRRQTNVSSSSPADAGLDVISAVPSFSLQPLPGQEGVNAIELKYQASVVPTEPTSFAILGFNVPEAKTAAAFLRSLLG